MPRIPIPPNAGRYFEIITTRSGDYAVWNHKTGKNRLLIPCRNREQAEQLLEKLQQGDHQGSLWI